MTDTEKIFFKTMLKDFAAKIINERITSLKLNIANAQEAANSEEKSSAGDKYETSRAMSHLEKDMQTKQLSENMKELSFLHAVNINTICMEAAAGAYLRCDKVSFFIAAGLGKQIINDEKIFFLSPHSPLAKSIQHKKKGENFLFNNAEIVINNLF